MKTRMMSNLENARKHNVSMETHLHILKLLLSTDNRSKRVVCNRRTHSALLCGADLCDINSWELIPCDSCRSTSPTRAAKPGQDTKQVLVCNVCAKLAVITATF